MKPRFYLDHNATTPLRPAARAAMVAALEPFGNPSSVHAEGRAARALVEQARGPVAALVGGGARNVVFTSGATEALALALRPSWRRERQAWGGLLLSATEHLAALQGHDFADARILPVDGDGRLDLAALESALEEAGRPVMLALQAANNETGVVQPVAEAAALVHAHGGLLVCDAVQAAGRIACGFATTGADMMILSAHKIGGPKGAGALVLGDGALHCDRPPLRGGGQEGGFRAGTENVPAIAGFGAAAAEALQSGPAEAARAAGLRDAFQSEIMALAPDMAIFGAQAPRLPNTLCFAAPHAAAETLLMALDIEGVAFSSGSACSSGKVRRSHVLEAMGVAPGLAAGALRASFGWNSVPGDVEAAVAALRAALGRIKRRA